MVRIPGNRIRSRSELPLLASMQLSRLVLPAVYSSRVLLRIGEGTYGVDWLTLQPIVSLVVTSPREFSGIEQASAPR